MDLTLRREFPQCTHGKIPVEFFRNFMQESDILLKAIAFNGSFWVNLTHVYCICRKFCHINHHFFLMQVQQDTFAMLVIGAIFICALSNL